MVGRSGTYGGITMALLTIGFGILARLTARSITGLLVEFIHRFEFGGTDTIRIRAIFVIGYKVIPSLVAGDTFLCVDLAGFGGHFSPYRGGLDVGPRADIAVGPGKDFPVNSVVIPIVFDNPVTLLAALIRTPLPLDESIRIQV